MIENFIEHLHYFDGLGFGDIDAHRGGDEVGGGGG